MDTPYSLLRAFPEYLLDRAILINDTHEQKVSGYKLATASEYFRGQLKDIRNKELEREKNVDEGGNGSGKRQSYKRTRTKSLSEVEKDCLKIKYDDLSGLEFALSFAHTVQSEQIKCREYLTIENLSSVFRAGLHFQMPSLVKFCHQFIIDTLNIKNCWSYWKISSDIKKFYKDIFEIIRDFILENFVAAANVNQIVNLPLHDLITLFRNDELNCPCELELVKVMNKWIDFNPGSRLRHCPKIMEAIRLGQLTQDEITEISEFDHIKDCWSQCSKLFLWSRLSVEDIINRTEAPSSSSNAGDVVENALYMKTPRLPREALFIVGGWEGNQDDPNFGPSRAVQIFDSRTDSWQRYITDPFGLDDGHAYSGCVYYKDRIYLIGGYVAAGPTQTLKAYEFQSKKWRYLSPMHEKRNYICACLMDGKIYAIGGHNGRTRLNTVEKYDPELNSWVLIAPMNLVRSDAGADSLRSCIYVCGGFDGFHFHSTVEMYEPNSNQWSIVAPMSSIRSGVSAVRCGSAIYAIGGNDGLNRLRTVERYDPEQNSWRIMTPMIRQRSNFCIAVLENKIYAMGGWSDEMNSTIALVECWEPGPTNTWNPVMHLNMPASANCCCTVLGLHNMREHLNR